MFGLPKTQSERKPLSKTQIFFVMAFIALAGGLKAWQYHWPEAVVEVGGEEVTVLVAKTPWHWHKGLGGRETLSPYDAMLFVFPLPERHTFVMRDTLFPIDIVWFNAGQVVDIAPSVPTELGVSEDALTAYIPRAEATAVMEFPAGWAAEHDLRIGDSLRIIRE